MFASVCLTAKVVGIDSQSAARGAPTYTAISDINLGCLEWIQPSCSLLVGCNSRHVFAGMKIQLSRTPTRFLRQGFTSAEARSRRGMKRDQSGHCLYLNLGLVEDHRKKKAKEFLTWTVYLFSLYIHKIHSIKSRGFKNRDTLSGCNVLTRKTNPKKRDVLNPSI